MLTVSHYSANWQRLASVAEHKNTFLTAALILVLALFCGCSSGSDVVKVPTVSASLPAAPTANLPSLTAGAAVLDWNAASIALPLDRYGMSPREVQVANAALAVVFARCATGRTAVSSAVLEDIGAALRQPADVVHWLYGYWDAAWIAENGWLPTASGYPPYLETDDDTAASCVADDAYMAVRPASTSVPGPEGEGFEALLRYSMEAYERAALDPRFAALQDAVAACVAERGFPVDDEGPLKGVQLDHSQSEEQILKAVLAGAGCSDDLQVPQQAGDINAAYERRLIDEHEAELVAIRAKVDGRVAAAEAVLREVGLM
jgi:hypothetical protein